MRSGVRTRSACSASLILFFGVLSAMRMRSDVLPPVDIPVVLVVWSYPGLPAEEMEKKIVLLSERAYSTTVNGVAQIHSESITGVGLLKIYFESGTDIGAAIAQIDSVSSTTSRNMPPGTHPPIILPYNAANVPVAQIMVSGKGKSEEELVEYAHVGVRLRLFTLPGTATPAPYGGKSTQINVDVETEAAAARGCSAREVIEAVLHSNPNLPAGSARLGDTRYDVLINNSPRTLDEFREIVVKVVEGAPVLLGDVARVYFGSEVQQNIVRVDGQRATYLAIVRKANASTLAVVDGARELLPMLRETAPEGIALTLNFDQSVFVRAAIAGVVREALVSAGLVTLLMLFALGSWRNVVIVATSIPLAVCVALCGLYLTGQTLNLMTLGGIALAMGMLVDDATVEVENIHRNHATKPLLTAILDGAQQIALPTLASTLCICVVFLPVALLEGPARFLFVPLALGVVFAMLASYVLSRTLVPTLAAMLMHQRLPTPGRGLWARFNAARDRGLERLQSVYGRALRTVFRRRASVLVLGAACLVACGGLARVVGYELFPEVDVGQMRLHVRARAGLRLEETERLTERVEKLIRETIPASELETISATIGLPTYYNLAFIQTDSIGPEDADILIALRRGHRPTAGYRALLRKSLPRALPGTQIYFQPADIVSQVLNFGVSAPIDVQIEGKNLEQSAAVARELRDRLRELPGAVDVRVAQVFSHPALKVDVNRKVAPAMGITQEDVATDVLTSLNSSALVAPSFWVDPATNQNFFVTVQAQPEKLTKVGDLTSLPVSSSSRSAPTVAPYLGALATVQPWQSSAVVSHENVQRVVDVRCSVEGRDLGSVAREIEGIVAQTKLPPGMHARAVGQARVMFDAFRGLGFGLLLAGMLAYLIMVVLFQSWTDPLVVLGAVPGALGGILVALTVTRTSLNVESFMGAIMAIGLALANSILVVSFANDLRNGEGAPSAAEAAIVAAQTRMRPSADDRRRDDPRHDSDGAWSRRRRGAERTARPRGDRRARWGNPHDADLRPHLVRTHGASPGGTGAPDISNRAGATMIVDAETAALPDRPSRAPIYVGIASLIGLLALAAGFARAEAAREKAERIERRAEVASGANVVVAPVEVAPDTESITVTAEVRAWRQVSIYPKIDGYLRELRVDKGDTITEGLVAVVVSPEVEHQTRSAMADYALQQQNEQRVHALKEEGLASTQEYERANGARKIAEAELGRQRTLRGYQWVRAPFDGTVIARHVDPGALLTAPVGASQDGTAVVDIADMTRVRIYAYLGQRQVSRVAVGDAVQIVTDGEPTRARSETITRTSRAIDPRTRTMLIEIDADNSNGALVPGSFVGVKFALRARVGLVVPAEALSPFAKGRRRSPLCATAARATCAWRQAKATGAWSGSCPGFAKGIGSRSRRARTSSTARASAL